MYTPTVSAPNLKALAFQQAASQLLKNGDNVRKALAIVIGIHIARCATLPSSECQSGEEHYVAIQAGGDMDRVSKYNEIYTLDFDLAVRTARAMWLKRYYSAFPQKVIALVDDDCSHPMSRIFGTAHLLAPETSKFISENGCAIISLLNRLTQEEASAPAA